MMRSILYPAARKDMARALARLPAPTIAIRRFLGHLTGMSGRIAESVWKLPPKKTVELRSTGQPRAAVST